MKFGFFICKGAEAVHGSEEQWLLICSGVTTLTCAKAPVLLHTMFSHHQSKCYQRELFRINQIILKNVLNIGLCHHSLLLLISIHIHAHTHKHTHSHTNIFFFRDNLGLTLDGRKTSSPAPLVNSSIGQILTYCLQLTL